MTNNKEPFIKSIELVGDNYRVVQAWGGVEEATIEWRPSPDLLKCLAQGYGGLPHRAGTP